MASPIPKARYKAPQEIVERIDLRKAEVLRLRKTANSIEAKASAIYRKNTYTGENMDPRRMEKITQADAWMVSAAAKRKKADHIETSYMSRLKEKLQTISTALLPLEDNTDISIPK